MRGFSTELSFIISIFVGLFATSIIVATSFEYRALQGDCWCAEEAGDE